MQAKSIQSKVKILIGMSLYNYYINNYSLKTYLFAKD